MRGLREHYLHIEAPNEEAAKPLSTKDFRETNIDMQHRSLACSFEIFQGV